jgi:hypothetical protein
LPNGAGTQPPQERFMMTCQTLPTEVNRTHSATPRLAAALFLRYPSRQI